MTKFVMSAAISGGFVLLVIGLANRYRPVGNLVYGDNATRLFGN